MSNYNKDFFKLEDVIEIIPFPAFFKEVDGDFLHFNNKFFEFFQNDQNTSANPGSFRFDEATEDLICRKELEMLKNPDRITFEMTVHSETSGITETEFILSPFKPLNGGKLVYLGLLRDNSVRNKLEKELLFFKKKAEKSENLKNMYLSNASYQIRNYTHMIKGFADLATKYKKSEKYEEYFSIIEYSTNALSRIVNNLMELSLSDAQGSKTCPGYLILRTYLAKFLQILTESSRIKKLH